LIFRAQAQAAKPIDDILNFGGEMMRDGVRRLVNNHTGSVSSAPLRE
jgi:hypothetical protein